jgi:methionyl-tRNA formyltransferase
MDANGALNPSAMDLLFFGSGAFGLPTLRALAGRHRLRAIITQPDRPAGRGSRLTPTPIAEYAREHLPQVPILKPENVNAPQVAAEIQAFKAQAAVVIAFGQKLSPQVLPPEAEEEEGGGGGAVRSRAINLHASLLPRWRGAAPIHAAILAGDRETGNSVITIAPRMDAGLILAQSRLPIDPLITAGELHDRLAEEGPALVLEVLERMRAGVLTGTVQDEALVTRAAKLHKRDGFVDFAQGAEACRRRVHGLTPWPGVTAAFRGEPLKLLRVRAVERAHSAAPGTLIDAAAGLVACGAGERADALQLLEVQPAGGRKMTWEQFAPGRRPTEGEVIAGGVPPC